jgi:hypothetical protein
MLYSPMKQHSMRQILGKVKTACHSEVKFISDQHLQICKTLQLFASLFTKYYSYLQAYLQNITDIYKLINKILQLFTRLLTKYYNYLQAFLQNI